MFSPPLIGAAVSPAGVQTTGERPQSVVRGIDNTTVESDRNLDAEELRRQNEELRSQIVDLQEFQRMVGMDGLSVSEAPPSYRTDQGRSIRDHHSEA